MRQLRFLAAVLLFTSFASAAPVITSITPAEGSESGGTSVIIHGSGFSNNCPGCNPQNKPPDVFFGGVAPSTWGYISSTELSAITPPHAPGKVAVKVAQFNGEFTLADAFTYTKDPFSMSPRSGPEQGGTVVTIKGAFGSFPYAIIFGETFVPTWRTAADTVVAVSPPGAPGSHVPITIWEHDIGIPTNLVFTYESTSLDGMERVLLPVLTPPSSGAFGTRFVTELRAYNRSVTDTAELRGLSRACTGQVCAGVVPDPQRDAIDLAPQTTLLPLDVVYNGTPGRFIWVPKDQLNRLWLNLRAYDESRSSFNFGTDLPIVRDRDFFRNEPIVFPDIPTGQGFRSTLRIYAESAVTVTLDITNGKDFVTRREVALQPAMNKFDPAYAQIGDLPEGVGNIRIRIIPPEPGQPGFYTPMWAFIGVTNNFTQLITTVRP